MSQEKLNIFSSFTPKGKIREDLEQLINNKDYSENDIKNILISYAENLKKRKCEKYVNQMREENDEEDEENEEREGEEEEREEIKEKIGDKNKFKENVEEGNGEEDNEIEEDDDEDGRGEENKEDEEYGDEVEEEENGENEEKENVEEEENETHFINKKRKPQKMEENKKINLNKEKNSPKLKEKEKEIESFLELSKIVSKYGYEKVLKTLSKYSLSQKIPLDVNLKHLIDKEGIQNLLLLLSRFDNTNPNLKLKKNILPKKKNKLWK